MRRKYNCTTTLHRLITSINILDLIVYRRPAKISELLLSISLIHYGLQLNAVEDKLSPSLGWRSVSGISKSGIIHFTWKWTILWDVEEYYQRATSGNWSYFWFEVVTSQHFRRAQIFFFPNSSGPKHQSTMFARQPVIRS